MNIKQKVREILENLGFRIYKYNDGIQYKNIHNKYKDYTMIRKAVYCDNLDLINNYVNNIKGCVVECGVWRGGMIAGVSEILKDKNREYFLFDSFEGLPEASNLDGEAAVSWQANKESEEYYDNCKAEIQYAEKAMRLTPVKYSIIKGWFNDTLPKFKPNTPIALLRLDGDWYESTMTSLTNLYPIVNENGLIILDDYYTWDGCTKAVHDYLSSINSISKIQSSIEGVCFIKKLDLYLPYHSKD